MSSAIPPFHTRLRLQLGTPNPDFDFAWWRDETIFTEDGDFYEATMDSNALARLKAVAGRQTLTLTHYGRKSGKPYNVTIWFAVEGDKVYIGTANVNRQWVRNVQKKPRIRLAVGGETC